jgi:hypothetical protein
MVCPHISPWEPAGSPDSLGAEVPMVGGIAMFSTVVLAGVPTFEDVVRAVQAEDRRVLCEILKTDPSCRNANFGNRDANVSTACTGLAHLLVARTTDESSFSGMVGGNFVSVDSTKYMQALCADHPEMLQGLVAQVDHKQQWSVVGFAGVAELVPGRESVACEAWREAVTGWPSDPERDLDFRGRLEKLADCGDEATIRSVFGSGLDASATGQVFLGLAYEARRDPTQACAAHERAFRLDPGARAAHVTRSAALGLIQTCGSQGHRIVGEIARAGARETGRPPDQRLAYASYAYVGLDFEQGSAARCEAVTEALAGTPVFPSPPPPRSLAIHDCPPPWPQVTAQRLAREAASAEEQGRAEDARALEALSTWVSSLPR